MVWALIIYGSIAIGLAGSFTGMLFLARHNRKKLARAVFFIALVLLAGWVTLFVIEDYDISRALFGMLIASHLGYMLAGAVGWVSGGYWRRKTFQ